MRGNVVLARKPGESIQIGDDITVTVVRLNGRQVRLMVSADRSLNIRRSEIEPIDGAADIEVGAIEAAETIGASLPIVGTGATN